MYKASEPEKQQPAIDLIVKMSAPDDVLEEQIDLTPDFGFLCQQFLRNFKLNDLDELNKIVEEMKKYAYQTSNPILHEFQNNNLAYYLTKFLDIDQTPNTITCISYCLAHEDEISDFFLDNGFLFKAAEMINNAQFISPTLTALSNIASCSISTRDCILVVIPIETLIGISSQFIDDELIFKKIACLLMNLSRWPPVNPALFNFFIDALSNSSIHDARKYVLWGLHYSLSKPTNLSDICIEIDFASILTQLIQEEAEGDLLYIELKLLLDLFQLLPSSHFKNFNINLVLPFLYSNDIMLVKTAMHLFEKIVKGKNGQLVEENFLGLCKNIISESNFQIKRYIYDIVMDIIDILNVRDLVSLQYQGVVEILYDILDVGQVDFIKKSIKSMTRLIYNSISFQKKLSPSFNQPITISPCQFLITQIETFGILDKIQEISCTYDDDDSLINEINIFESAYHKITSGCQI